MSHIEFARLVHAMRKLQVEFFATKAADRPPSLIGEAKAKEREVDREIQRILGQPRLFGMEEQ